MEGKEEKRGSYYTNLYSWNFHRLQFTNGQNGCTDSGIASC